MSSVAQEFVKIGAVKVPIEQAKNPELVPTGFGLLQILFYLNSIIFPVTANQPNSLVQTLKWMLQKNLLHQDVFLMGNPGFLRNSIVFQFLVSFLIYSFT